MGVTKVPSGAAPEEQRIEAAKVWYTLWYVPEYPLAHLNGKLDKDVTERPWLLGLLEAIRTEGRFLNPVIVWNHHANRLTGKQPTWLLRAGSNRVWCAEQLGWTHVPAIVSVATYTDLDIVPGMIFPMHPEDLADAFPDGGRPWANEHGFGLLRAKPPEITYAGYVPTPEQLQAVKPTNHDRSKLINPLLE